MLKELDYGNYDEEKENQGEVISQHVISFILS